MILRGKIEGKNDFVNFESDSPINIEKEFHDAVDDYLEFCAEVGKEPDREYKGIFNVRIPSELHKQIALLAVQQHITLNQFVVNALSKSI